MKAVNKINQTEGRGSGTVIGYAVEARVIPGCFYPSQPPTLGDGVLTPEWRRVQFERGMNPAGVPGIGHMMSAEVYQWLPYESAVALAWTIIAQHRYSVECRIVELSQTYSYENTFKGVVDLPPIQHHLSRVPLVKEDAIADADAGKPSETTNCGSDLGEEVACSDLTKRESESLEAGELK